jgi:hypothetical protein
MNGRASVIALYYSPWPADGQKRPPKSRPLAQYRYAVWYKANPRDAGYMRALQQERLQAAEWVEAVASDWIDRVSNADKIVLIYPDAIGLGFGAIERAVLKHKKASSTVDVLNGRRRQFSLTGATRAALRLRRLLERTMLLELLFIPVFIVVTPVLWTVDAVRGRT